MARVPHCKGSYSKKNGYWQIAFPLGWDSTRKCYPPYYETFSSEAEAIAAIKDINTFIYHGGNLSEIAAHRHKTANASGPKAISFKEFAEEFCILREKQGNVTQRTAKDNQIEINRILPYIGTMPLKDITAQDLDEAYACMKAGDPRNSSGKPYSGTTILKTHSTITLVFDKAVDYGYRSDNPCKKASRPKNDTKEKIALTVSQSQKLVAAVLSAGLKSKTVGLLICLCCATRLSEMLALTWADFNGDTLHIDKSLVTDTQMSKPTKTEDVRDDPCPAFLVDTLNAWKAIQREELEALGIRQSGQTPIVNNKYGAHTIKSTFERWFRNNKDRWPLPEGFTIHGLRHSATTILQRDLGVDAKTTMSITGHKSMQMLGNYSHTDMDAKREAMRRMDSLIAPADDTKRCRNCRKWTANPENTSLGVCWAKTGKVQPVTSISDECSNDGFIARGCDL